MIQIHFLVLQKVEKGGIEIIEERRRCKKY